MVVLHLYLFVHHYFRWYITVTLDYHSSSIIIWPGPGGQMLVMFRLNWRQCNTGIG